MSRILLPVLILLTLATVLPAPTAHATTGLTVSPPNGYATVAVDDLTLQSPAGEVRWTRHWNGQEWQFNPHWESLSHSWKNLTGSQSADTTATTGNSALPSSSGGSGGCWIWVDEDWQPTIGTATIGGIPEAGPMLPERTTPFNRLMGEASADYPPIQRVSVDYANLCAGTQLSGSYRDSEGIRRINELYLGEGGRYAFNHRTVLEKRPVQQLPATAAASLDAQLATGRLNLNPQTNAKGFSWIDRGGDWIDYNTQGQVIAWGDKNNNTVWLARDSSGQLRGVVDGQGRVLYTLHYTGALLTEIRDTPIPGLTGDLPARRIQYQYDDKNRLTQVTDARGHTTRYAYDGGNHLTRITDPAGHIEQLTYAGDTVKQRAAPDGGLTDYVFEYDDANKQFISKITGPTTEAGRRVEDFTHNRAGKRVRRVVNGRIDEEIRYDTGARAELSRNARGNTTKLIRNEYEQIVEIHHPDGGIIKRSYTPQHLGLTEEIDQLGNKTTYAYDTRGNLTQKTEAAGTADPRITDYQINDQGQPSRITRKGRVEADGRTTPDAVWQLEYDPQGRIAQTTDPEGNVRSYAHDRAGHLIVTTDPLGRTTRYQVDAAGNLVQTTDALGRVRSFQHDVVGNLTRATDARAQATLAAYDAMNRVTRITNPVGGASQIQYNGQGLPTQASDEDGRTTRYQYDAYLRLTTETDGLNHTTRYAYQIPDGTTAGTLGALYAPTETQYPSFTRQQRYDALERPISDTLLNPTSTGTEGLLTTTQYDKRGQTTRETDANGHSRTQTWDAHGQLSQLTDANGHTTQAQYDARGNLIRLTDARGHATRFDYDRNDRLITETLPLGQATTYTHDPAGRLHTRTGPTGNRQTHTVDAAGRITSVTDTRADGSIERTTRYTWDAEDHLTGWSDGASSTVLSYDAAGRKTGETLTYPNGTTLTYGYAYSPAGLKTRLTWPDGTAIDYGYSGHGQLESVAIPGEGTISVNQFKWLEPVKVTLPGGVTQERTLDGLLYPENLRVKTPGQQTVLQVADTWGKVQELKSQTRSDSANTTSSTVSSSYTYDHADRLTQVVTDAGGTYGTTTEAYTLDALGNRIAHSPVNGTWTYDGNNRLLQRGTGSTATTYQYDDAGNLTVKSEPGRTTRYVYDTRNRLVEVATAAGLPIARYGYDPLDRRLWKEQYRDRSGVLLATGKRTYYLYADEGLIAEAEQAVTLDADGSVTASGDVALTTQYGPQPDAPFTTGILFIKTKNTQGQTVFAYYHRDHLGTPLQATDKNGNLVWSARYDPFGRATITTPAGAAAITSNLRLPGQYEDSETGLHNNGRRYYNPDEGRYLTQDPIGLEGGDNLYGYVGGDPINATDPTGELAVIGGVIGGLGNLGYQLYKNDGNLKCVNWWQVGAWALTGSGAGILGRAGVSGIGSFISNSRSFSSISRAYWRARGGARGMSLDHWAVSQATGRSGAVPQSLVNGGWNLLEMPASWNTWLGFAPNWGGTQAALANAARFGIQVGVPGLAAGSGYAGYLIGTNAQQSQCGCQ